MSIRDIAEPVSLNDGTAMPGYGCGCYAAHGEEIINAIRWAVRDGYRYIDSAAMYGNEAEVGEAIRTCGVQREDLFISSKIWPTRFDDPDASLAQSLRDLGIDALDCCLLNWPGTDRKLIENRSGSVRNRLEYRTTNGDGLQGMSQALEMNRSK